MSDPESFQAQVDGCMSELTGQLPEIAARRSSLALLIALAEHVGGALNLFMQSGSCTPAQAREVLKRAERVAFNPC